MNRIAKAMILATVVMSVGIASATDGTWIKDSSGNCTWSTTGYWIRGTVPDGGLATFWSCPAQMNIDLPSVTLRGLLRSGNRATTFTNEVNGLTFTGETPFLINSASQMTMKGPLVGTGSNRLEIGGNGGMKFENLASNFGEVAVVDGAVTLPATSGTILSHGNVSVGDGEIRVSPALAAGESADLTMCDDEGSRFVCGPGFGRLSLNHGEGEGVTLTLPSIAISNGALCVNSATSLASLGEADKLLVSDPPEVVNGMVSPGIALYDATSTKTGTHKGSFFATYDSEKGLVPAADPVAWDAAADQSAAIVRLADSATIATPKSVYAMYWDLANNRKLTLDSDLKVLSGGLIANIAADDNVSGVSIDGEGAIDFGDRQGVLRGSAFGSSANRTVSIALNAPVKGTKGIVFSGTPAVLNGNYVGIYNYSMNVPAAWTGPTVIANGVKLSISDAIGAQAFPAGGDVYVIGGDHRGGASIRITNSATFDQNFVISGGGTNGRGSNNTGPFHIGGSNVTLTFNGTTRFRDIVYFAPDGGVYLMKFVGKVSGAGLLDMRKGVLEFAGENDYQGSIMTSTSEGTLVVSGNGSLGSADVSVTKGSLKLNNLNGQTLANNITCTGTLTIDGGRVALTGRVTSAKTIIKNGAVVEIGDNVDLGQVAFQNGSKVLSATGSTKARVEIGGDGVADINLQNGLSGESDVLLVKSGTNTVTVNKNCALGGDLKIAEGTLKLAPGLLATASFWLDASRAETVTSSENKATAWRSANGNGRVFTYATADKGEPGTYPGPQMNGLDTMHFDHTDSTYTWFVCDTTVDIRSIYTCMKPYFYDPEKPVTLSPWGWYGKGNPEYGLRWATYSTWHDLSFTSSKKRVNGGKTSVPAKPDGVPLIIGQFLADDSTEPKTMQPSIGGYQTWSRAANAYNGDIGEVIAFDHEITEDEKKVVEQYLSAKWGVYDAAGLWPEVNTSCLDGGAVLADTARVTLVDGAVLDLNGADQTIAALAGAGLITNSSAKVATLTVTGACDFTGVIAANVRLVAVGTVRGEVNGELVADGGTVTLADGEYAPPANGRLWWFDASEVTDISATANTAGSIKTNASGRVTTWYSKGDAGTYFSSINNGGDVAKYAQYVEAAEGVRAGLYMNAQVGLVCNQANTPYTIAVVYEFDASFSSSSYFFCGYGFGDAAMRVYSGKTLDNEFNFFSRAAFSNYGDHIYVNGKRIEIDGNTSVTLPQATVCCYIGTRDPSHTDTNWVNRQFCIGSSCWSKGTFGTKVCEAICYDRLLSDDECRALNTYLVNKWNGKSAPKAKISADAVLGATGGGTLDVSAAAPVSTAKLVSNAAGGTVTGDLTISGFSYDAEGATAAVPLAVDGALTIAEGADFTATELENLERTSWTLLSAESATGAFETFAAGPRKWTFDAKATSWGLCVPGLLLFIK